MPKSIRDIAIAVFFLVLSGTLIFGFRIGQSAYEDFKLTKQAELKRIDNFTRKVEKSGAFIEKLYEDLKLAKQDELKRIDNFTSKLEKSGAFIEELSVLIAARSLEEWEVLPETTADEFARESIQVIKQKHSDRVGKLLEAINDAYLRKRKY